MSIASELTALQGDITSARSAIVAKGGTVTDGGGSSQLADDIATIPASSGDLDGIIDGTLTEFVMPAGKTTLKQYRFYTFQQLTRADLRGCVSIEDYAFANCGSLEDVIFPQRLYNIKQHAFESCTKLKSLNFNVVGTIDSDAFYQTYKVSSVNIGNSVISSLGEYAFGKCGYERTQPSENILLFDFSNSTFTSIPKYCFGSDAPQYSHNYSEFIFPTSVGAIQNYAFRYAKNCNLFFKRTTPPNITSSAFQNASNNKIFVPYNNVNAYRTATNWTAQSSYIRGFAPAGTFEVGDTLPEITDDGYEMTWYSDKALTVPVTTVSDANAEYYCTVGTVKVAYKIGSVGVFNCTVAITDGTKNYTVNDMVRIGTVLTITGAPTVAGYTPYAFKVNGQDFTSGDTITVSSDISVSAVYWDGEHVPINPDFGQNGWDIIASQFKAGTASQYWSVGDTKSVTLTNGQTFTIRIADMQSGRYNYADGTGSSKGVLEFVELQPTYRYMNSSNTNAGGWAQCYMRSTVMTELYNLLPSDMQLAISEVNVLSGTGSSTTSGTSSSANKLFLPAEMEIFSTKTYSIGNTECPLGQFDWYRTHNTNADRIKRKADNTAYYWWLRSPNSGYSSSFCYVNNGGTAANDYANTTSGVAPCFAI